MRMRIPLLLLLAWIGLAGQALAAGNYSENFNSNTATGWSSSSLDGVQTFSATGGSYTNDNHNTAWTISTYGGDSWTTDYSYSVDLNSQFGGGTANAVGAIYGFQDTNNYYKVWFNMQGEADIYRVTGGAATQVAHTTSFSMAAKTWFTVRITRSGTTTSVSVNGTPLFSNVSQPEITAAGKLGVIAEWNFAEFDNVAVSLNGYSQNFNDNTAASWSSRSNDGVQTFSATNGYYTNDNHNTSWTSATYDGGTWTTNFTYSVDLNSQFGGGTANAVGAVYGYQDSSNYYKVWFNMLGEADIYRVSSGTATQVAHTTSFQMTAKTWFTVQITRSGTNTSVTVNGTPLFTNVSQPEITTAGKIGVIAEWNFGEFDNVMVTSNSGQTLYATDGPPFPRLGTTRISNPFDWDDPTEQQTLAQMHVAIIGYFNGWTNPSRQLNTAITNIKSESPYTNFPTKVFLYNDNEQFRDDGTNDSIPTVVNELNSMNWWLYNGSGTAATNRVHDPQSLPAVKAYIVNTTQFAKDGSTSYGWVHWFANNWIYPGFYQPNNLIDGLYTDNFAIQPLADGDYNEDTHSDSASDPTVAGWFRAGLAEYVKTLKALLPSGKYELGNIGDWGQSFVPAPAYPEYQNLLNGGVLEGYIGKSYGPEINSWSDMLTRYRKVMNAVTAPKLVLLGTSALMTDYKTMRYGLASCMMDDGYFAFSDGGDPNHIEYSNTPLFDEYKIALGYPTDPPPTAAWQNGIWRRNFQNGTVLVNPRGNNNGNPVTVTLEPGYKRFSGTQDPATNNGQPATTVTLQARDGLILIKQ